MVIFLIENDVSRMNANVFVLYCHRHKWKGERNIDKNINLNNSLHLAQSNYVGVQKILLICSIYLVQ